MNTNPLVSVVLIFLNEERFLPEAIESVLAQTHRNWELLLVDDGSTDGSTEIARRYARTNPERIRYLEHDGHANRGISATRNLGIRHARGTYIAHLDGDNVWLPEKLAEQSTILEAHPEAAFVYGPMTLWYTWKGAPPGMQRHGLPVYGAGRTGVHPFADSLVQPPDLVSLCLVDPYCDPDGVMIRKQALEKVGNFEEQFRGLYEDTAVMVKVGLESPVFVSSKSWQLYRMHPGSLTHVANREGTQRSAELTFLDWVEDYFTRKQVRDRKLWWALRRARWHCRHERWYRLADPAHLAWRMKTNLRAAIRAVLPGKANDWILSQWRALFPPQA